MEALEICLKHCFSKLSPSTIPVLVNFCCRGRVIKGVILFNPLVYGPSH